MKNIARSVTGHAARGVVDRYIQIDVGEGRDRIDSAVAKDVISFEFDAKMIQKTSFPFEPQKATEVAGRFIALSGGSINIMKLVKMVYLLDRESIARRGVPVVGGVYLSMRNGPVTSEILDLINAGELWHCDTSWSEFISDRQNHQVALDRDPGTEHLSNFELELIEELFSQFASADQWEISEWCHEHCGEWLPLDKGAEPISLAELAEEVGRSAEEVLENAAEQNFLARVFG